MRNRETQKPLNIGETAEFSKTISESDVYLFAGITGDLNPMHVNEEYCRNTRFKKRIAHGMLASSLVCTALGMRLPGVGTIHISQELQFLNPVFFGDTLTARLEIIEFLEKARVKIRTDVFNQDDVCVVSGFAVVLPPKELRNEIQ